MATTVLLFYSESRACVSPAVRFGDESLGHVSSTTRNHFGPRNHSKWLSSYPAVHPLEARSAGFYTLLGNIAIDVVECTVLFLPPDFV